MHRQQPPPMTLGNMRANGVRAVIEPRPRGKQAVRRSVPVAGDLAGVDAFPVLGADPGPFAARSRLSATSLAPQPASPYPAAMSRQQPLPMTLGNMRANGVRAVIATCLNRECRHKADVVVDQIGDDVAVPEAGQRMRCTKCGERKIETWAAWHLAKRSGMGA